MGETRLLEWDMKNDTVDSINIVSGKKNIIGELITGTVTSVALPGIRKSIRLI